MRWRIAIAGLVLLAAVTVGCKQQCFMTECDLDRYRLMGLPSWLECKPGTSLEPSEYAITTAPATVTDPDRPIRYLSLAEAIAIALEQGNIGSQIGFAGQFTAGFPNDNLGPFQGRQAGGLSDNIRVLALDPAIQAAEIELSLSKFDAVWFTSLNWNTTDRPVGTPLDVFQTGQTGINAISTNDAQFRSSLIKPLPTGGVAGLTFNTDYQFTNLPARVNPSYRPALQFQFEQPLLEGFGVEINQLRGSFPQPRTLPFLGLRAAGLNGPADGILLTRIRFDQSRAEFERVINTMMLNVEVAYWNLYGAYWNLYSREQALRQAYEAWKINKLRYEAGREDIANLAQARGQFELFRDQRISALNQVLESERNLRSLLGMPAGDDFRFVPIDTPTLAPYQPDWTTALNDALALRPELMIAREELKARQLDVIWIKNLLLPDLRVFATYDINGIGNRLDGPEADNAFRSLASNHFNSWQIGTRLEFPLGYRDAHAQTRVARLQLARSYYALRDQERKAEQNLAFAYRQLAQLHLRIQALRAQRQAFGEQLHARFQAYSVGKTGLDILLEAQRFWADALANEFNVIAQYNSALAGFEFARGTLLQHNNVIVSEGQLPKCAQKRAVEHENQKAASLVLGERALPHTAYGEDGCGLPKLGPDDAPSLPSLLKGAPPVPKEQPEPLPPPSKVMPPAKTQGEGPDKGPALPTGAVPAGSLAPSTTSAPRLRGDGR